MKYISLTVLMAIITTALSAQEKTAFKVSFTEPQAHYADIEMEISDIKDDHIDLKMPVWTPGSYLIREFAKNVEDFQVHNSANAPLPFSKVNKNTWRVHTAKNSSIRVSYRVYSFEVSVRTSFVDESHAFLSPSGLFLYPAGKLSLPSTITILPAKAWTKISTALDKTNSQQNTFRATNFDILYDSPIEVGNQDIFEFTAAGVNHEVAMYGGGNYDKEVLKRDMAKIIHEQTKVFGVNPNKRYVFIVHNMSTGGGGLEHLNSTVLGAARNAYNTEAGLLRFLALVSHEYFHLWNVKRLRPIALGPFNYDEENYTTNLWIAEGFTSYYQDIFTKRAGLISPEQYLSKLASSISMVENQPGGRVQTVSESSFDAWIKHYRPNENSPNSTISYYSKGALIGFIMDLEIIHSTQGKAGLDEVMKAMYDEYYVKKQRGYTDEEFRAMAEKVAGKSLNDIYNKYVNGLTMIDYNTYLNYAGLTVSDSRAERNEAYLGVATALREGKMIITQVARGSGAWSDGLSVNDEIVSIDGYTVRKTPAGSTELLKYIAGREVGEKVKVTLIRDGLNKEVEVTLNRNPSVNFVISTLDNPNDTQLAVRKRWLKL